jgi:hypothetical protein
MEIKLRLSDRHATGNLLDFFQRRDLPAESAGNDLVVVRLPDDLEERQVRMEIDLLLRIWEAMNPGVRVEFESRG